MRMQLARPDADLVDPDTFNQMFTMHGTTMIFMVIMPLGAAFFNFVIPLAIGARDVAFPRLNAFSYWVFLFGALLMYSSFLVGTMPDAGWFSYANLTEKPFSSNAGLDFWALGLQVLGRIFHGRRLQLHRDHCKHAGSRDEPDADAPVRVDDLGNLHLAGPGFPGHHRRSD